METLILQAFQHVDYVGPHVRAGKYDLIGPNGEVIFPQVWETMIEPDWQVTMQLWPLPESSNWDPVVPQLSPEQGGSSRNPSISDPPGPGPSNANEALSSRPQAELKGRRKTTKK